MVASEVMVEYGWIVAGCGAKVLICCRDPFVAFHDVSREDGVGGAQRRNKPM